MPHDANPWNVLQGLAGEHSPVDALSSTFESHLPFVPVSHGSLAGMNTLSDDNVLIIPCESAGAIRRALDDGGSILKPSERGDNPVAFVGDAMLLAGIAWPDNTERLLDGAVWAATERQGRGNVVMFADDILFRGFWRGPAWLLTNAILFGPGR